jgi:hypothetical protein
MLNNSFKFSLFIVIIFEIYILIGKTYNGAFRGVFQRGQDLFVLNYPEHSKGQFRGQKGLGPLEKPQEMPHYMFCPRQKNNFQDFENEKYIGIFMSQRERDRKRERKGERKRERERERES